MNETYVCVHTRNEKGKSTPCLGNYNYPKKMYLGNRSGSVVHVVHTGVQVNKRNGLLFYFSPVLHRIVVVF